LFSPALALNSKHNVKKLSPAGSLQKEIPERSKKLKPASLTDNQEFYYFKGKKVRLLRKKYQLALHYKSNSNTRGAPFKSSQVLKEAQYRKIHSGLNEIEIIEPFDENDTLLSESQKAGKIAQIKSLLKNSSSLMSVSPVYHNQETNKAMVFTPRLIVKLNGKNDNLNSILAGHNLKLVRKLMGNTYLLELRNPIRSSLELANSLYLLSSVEWAEPEFAAEIEKFFYPDDTYFGRQQHLKNTGQNGGVSGADIKAEQAWDIEQGSSSVTVAIIDDGVQQDHPDLTIASGGKNYVRRRVTDDPWPSDDEDNHGTSCAGVAAAIGNNALGVSGIGQAVQILSLKIAKGYRYASNTNFGDAVLYGAANADVISISWGWTVSSYIESAIINASTNGRGGKGCPVFIAAGNSGSEFEYYYYKFSEFGLADGDYFGNGKRLFFFNDNSR
jgi:subtilisin family serine protease